MYPGEIANYAENLALKTVIEPVIQHSALARVHPNYPVELDNGSTRYIDFAIITDVSRIAIEIDGYSYHAEGVITSTQFNDQLYRQNELILQGWTILRFSFKQISEEPDKCMDQLRRVFVSDCQLHRNFDSHALEPSALQLEALTALKNARDNGERRGLVALPTGTGKTILSALDAKSLGGRVLFIVHSNDILRQAAAAYKKVFPNASVGFINSDHSEKGFEEDLIFANIASLRTAASYERFAREHFDYVVLDEFHHGAAPSYAGIVKYLKPRYMVGLTATPERTDRRDILALLDGNMVFGISVSAAIERGFLVPFTYFGLHDNVDYSTIKHNGFRYDLSDLERSLLIPSRDQAVIEKFLQHAEGRKSIGFCVSIKHAERMADVFQEAGIPSSAIHSGLPKIERLRRISLYEQGVTQCVFVRDLFNEGVDFPDTGALMFLRPTESRVIFLQQLGRGLRLSPSKTNVTVLDFIGNYVGAAEIPSLLGIVGTGNLNASQRTKPQYVFDNGCRIFFSERAIENLSIPDYRVVDKVAYIEKLAMLRERIGHPLTPLDIYLEIGDSLGNLIRSMGSYEKLVERMNRVGSDDIVLSTDFKKFNPDDSLAESSSAGFLNSQSEQILTILSEIVAELIKANRVSATRYKLNYSDALHKKLTSLLRLITPLCLVRATIAVHAADTPPRAPRQAENFQDLANSIFQFLAKRSPNRHSFAISNFLKAEFNAVANLSILKKSSGNGDENRDIAILDKLMDRKMLRWLSDLHSLTSPESLYQ